jgi:uncharacterized iron-regulated protein
MPTGEKNQVMKCLNAAIITDALPNWKKCCLAGLIIIGYLWGCTVTPSKKLFVEDLSESFEKNTIISSESGQPVTFADLLEDLNRVRIIYVGEKHTNRAHHEIQLQIIQAVYENNPNLAVGMEMFDYTYQDVLDQWSAGNLEETEFLRKVHWYANWRYDYALYRDILNFIKENRIRLIGLNIPGYVTKKIRVGGVENLREAEKKHLPQNIDLSYAAHREYVQKVFEDHKHHFSGDVGFEDFYAAQAVWEDIMAETIAQNLDDGAMVVLAGNGHIQYKYGIPDRAYRQTGVAFRTIYLEPAGGKVERDIADYIWVTE